MDEYVFKTTLFGGFNRKSVTKYVSDVVGKFEEQVSELKKGYEEQLSSKDEEISAKQTECRMFSVELQNVKDELARTKEQFSLLIETKDNELKSKDEVIRELEEKVKSLEIKVEEFKSEDNNIELRVQRTEDAAKKRISETIEHARSMIKKEYKDHLENMDLGRKVLINKAIGEASNIVNSAADRAKKVTDEAKEEVEKFVESAKNESSEILNFTNSMVDKILKDSVESIVREHVFTDFGDRNIVINFDGKALEDEIEKDVLAASKKLESCGMNCDKFGSRSGGNVSSVKLENGDAFAKDFSKEQDESEKRDKFEN